MRMVNPAVVLNALVFDCLEPPPSVLIHPQMSVGGGIGRTSGGLGGGPGGDDDGVASLMGGAADEEDSGKLLPGRGRTARRRRKGHRESSGGGVSSTGGSDTGEGGSMRRSRSTPDIAGLGGAGSTDGSGAAPGGWGSDARFRYFDDQPPWYSPKSPDDTTLVFESRFESGNLRRALQVGGEGGRRAKQQHRR